MKGIRLLSAWLVALALVVLTGSALGEVVREGQWPEEDPRVSLSVQNLARGEAIRRLAKEAGWSVVLQAPSNDPVDVEVEDQPATKVLEILLADGRWIAKRDGTLISIARAPAEAAASSAPALPAGSIAAPIERPKPAASAPDESDADEAKAKPKQKGEDHQRGDDRVVTGGRTRVEAGETVKDLVVLGGSAEVLGTVSGDLAVMGGSAIVRKTGKVEGDATVLGGTLEVEDGGEVEGDVGIVGGKLLRGDAAKIGGDVQQGKAKLALEPTGLLSEIGSAITRTALLFVFGAVLLALATRRMESLQGEVGGRPMRSFALGIIGFFVAVIAVIALMVTIIGIPIAIIALLFGVFATYAGICAVLATAGGALVQHKTKNPYIHLAVGCALFMLASAIPWIGGFVTVAVVVIGMGAVVATRGGGLLAQKRVSSDPYRSAVT